MKKSYLISILAVPMFFGFGFSVANSNLKMVKAEEIVEPEIEEVEEEKTLLDEFNEKYEEIKNKQIAGTTIGGIVGGLFGAIVAFVPAVLNRTNLKNAKDKIDLATKEVITIKEKYNIVDPKLDDIVNVLKLSAKKLEEASKLAEKTDEIVASLTKKHEEDIKLLLTIIASSPELVKSGIAEKLNEQFGGK